MVADVNTNFGFSHGYRNDLTYLQPSDHSSQEIEITLEPRLANSLRIIGSRSRGIFIDQINNDLQTECFFQCGDQIKSCNDKQLQGLTAEQVASLFRYSLNNCCSLRLLIVRHEKAAELMLYRRTLASVAQEQEEQWRQANSRHLQFATTSIASSKSLATLNSYNNYHRVYHVASSSSTATLKAVNMDEDREPLTDFYNGNRKGFRLSRSIHTFNTTEFREKVVCPICNKETRLKFLHNWTHSWMNSARRLLPYSKSENNLHNSHYSLL